MSGAGRERGDAISDIFVDTSRTKMAFERMDQLMDRGWETNFCRALLLLGPSRCGKTHILKEWRRRRTITEPGFKAVVTEVPSACTLKGMAAQLLEDLGDPDPDYGTQNDKTRRIHDIGKDCHLIIIDEVQRLIDEKTERVKNDVANWLTNLLNRRICPLLLVGERQAEKVFNGNMYLEGRTLGQVPVDPYDWHNKEDRNGFRVFLNLVEGKLGMPQASGLGDSDTALRIHSYSGGRVGQATLLIDEARSLARRGGRPMLTHDLFAEAVDLLRVGAARGKANPFRIEKPIAGGPAPTNVVELKLPKSLPSGKDRK